MPDSTTSVSELRQAMNQFVADREWHKFHSPKNLAMGLAIEAAELMEHFLWIDLEESRRLADDRQRKLAVGEEMADVACYLFALANALDLDLSDTIREKLKKNAIKYPVEKFRGNYKFD
jgi:NTP pyrophosphatase (non-canonical NTP hydrolase)